MYKESDKPNPINYYGKTKHKGENFIDTKKNIIVRTSIYGWNVVKERKSFSSWIIEELKNNRKINVFVDQFNSMMLVNDLAEALKELISSDFAGILNIASSERISKYDYAVKLAEIFNFDKHLINPIENQQVLGYEKRPLDVSLDISKAKELNLKLLDIRHSLLRMKELEEGNYLKNFEHF